MDVSPNTAGHPYIRIYSYTKARKLENVMPVHTQSKQQLLATNSITLHPLCGWLSPAWVHVWVSQEAALLNACHYKCSP